MFLARRRAFARHPLCRVLEKKKRGERGGKWPGGSQEERERERIEREEEEEEE